MSARTEKQKRIQNGERPYLASGKLIFRKDEQVEFGGDAETGDVINPLPTEDSLQVGLHGLCQVLRWNTISKEQFQHLSTEAITLDELRDILDQEPYSNGTAGEVSGGVAGAIHGYIEKYEAYVDSEGTACHYPLRLDNLPVSETTTPVAGQYVLFSIDEDTGFVGAVDIPDCQLDESKIQLHVERNRFGEIYFDMVRMKYEAQVVSDCRFQSPLTNGLKVFVLDADGFMHRVFLPVEENLS